MSSPHPPEDTTAAATIVALVAAFLFAVGAVAQQRAASDVPVERARGLTLIRRLVRRPLWWAGFVGDTGGFVVQAAALSLGALLLVGPLLVTSLLFALPLGARWAGRRVLPSDIGWAVVLTAALAVFTVAGNPTRGTAQAPFERWVPALVVIVPVVAGCLVAARLLRGTPRALLLAIAAGFLFGVLTALTKSFVDLLGDGFVALATSWESYALGVTALLGTTLQQSSYQAGALGMTLPTMTVLGPVVAGMIGVTVLSETVQADGQEWVLIAASLVAMFAGTVMLARSAARADTEAQVNANASGTDVSAQPDP